MSAKVLITGLSNTGKCQSVDTQIPTPTGWRRLGDLSIGDKVFTETGKETTVIGVYPQGVKKSYKLTFTDGTSTNSCDDHLWKVKKQSRTRKEWRILPLKDIIKDGIKGKIYKYSIPITQPVQYTEKDLPVHPYMLGVLIGDGSLTLRNIVLTSHTEDNFVQNRLYELDNSVWTNTVKKQKGENTLISVLNAKNYIAEYIKKSGLDVLSADKFIPKEYMYSSVKQRTELLAGLMDSDGTCNAKHNHAAFTTKSLELAKNVQELVQSLGGLARLKTQDRKEKGIDYSVTVSTLFNPFLLPRKANKWKPRRRNGIRKTLVEIQQVEDCEQLCIKVDNENETYLTNDFIVTHNTTLLKTLKDVLVFSRDGKPFSLEIPHVNVPDYNTVDELFDLVLEKLENYKDKVGEYPNTVAFDSVSRIFTDIETISQNKFRGFDVWSNVNREVNEFVAAINDMQSVGYNIILIAHAVFDPDAKKFIETCKGSFAKTGGFLSTVDYAINIDVVGNKRIVTHRGMHLSRTLLDDMPDKQSADEFNLQEYLEKVEKKSKTVSEKWSI